MKKIFLLLVALTLAIQLSTAACTITLNKATYSGGETAVATMSCDSPSQRSDPYTVTWNNGTAVVETDTGTTPSTTAQSFFETLQIPTGQNWTSANVTLSLVAVEDFATFTVTQAASSSALVIKNITFTSSSELFVGKILGIRALVTDENGNKISNANCQFDLEDGSNLPIVSEVDTSHDGIAQKDFDLNINTFEEGRQYIARVGCFCGGSGTTSACLDSSGNEISNSVGSGSNSFATQTWITVNTVTSDPTIGVGEEFSICANITNAVASKRLPIEIAYNWRCGSGSNSDTDRIVFGEYTELRGISASTTQMQCHDFIVPNEEHIEKGAFKCYGATDVTVLSETGESLVTYPTTSPQFNVSIYSIHPHSEFKRISQNSYKTNISIDEFDVGVKDVHIILDGDLNGGETSITSIKNYTITYLNGTAIPYSTEILFHHHAVRNQENLVWGDAIEIGIDDVNTTSDEEFTLTITFDNYAQRQADALEGIENKTGTFHLDVKCPSTAELGSDMNCSVTAQIEDDQLSQKEVDFTCFITDNTNEYSALNFNQMINKTPITLIQTFYVPANLTYGSSYVLQCYADYYNLGSRRDSFYDTFVAGDIIYNSGGGSSNSEDGSTSPGIISENGREIEETEVGEAGEKDDGKITSSPITGAIIGMGELSKGQIIITISATALIILSTLFFMLSKRKGEHFQKYQTRNKSAVFIASGILLIISVSAIIIFLSQFFAPTEVSNNKIIEDPMIRQMIFIVFLATVITVTMKILNIEVIVSLNKKNPIEKYWKSFQKSKV